MVIATLLTPLGLEPLHIVCFAGGIVVGLFAMARPLVQAREDLARVRREAAVARDLLDAAYTDDLTNLYESQGANQAHRVVIGIADGVEPMLPRATRFGPYDPSDPDQIF